MKLKVKGVCHLCSQATQACYRVEMDGKECSIKCNATLEVDESNTLRFYTIFTTGANILSDFPVDAHGEVPTFVVCKNPESL